MINAESTVTKADGTTALVAGVSFNRETLNQDYSSLIAGIDLTPEHLETRLDAFTMAQMQGSGNVPHLMIAAWNA